MPLGRDFFGAPTDAAGIKHNLHSPDPAIQTQAVKQIIAFMTVGKDMTSHFSDVARLLSTQHFELKKLVYLYLIQNAMAQPEKAVLHAGSFVRDATHSSPLIRGIAIRTMTSLQIPAMADFAHSAVLKAVRDTDPYVRRNAIVAAVKLHHVTPQALQQSGILHELLGALDDPIASVVAAATCSLCELSRDDTTGTLLTALLRHTDTLLHALGECGEWCQLYLLEGVALFFKHQQTGGAPPQQPLAEAEVIVTRVLPFLQSHNPAVVLQAVAVVANFLQAYCTPANQAAVPAMRQQELELSYGAKMAQPLVSLTAGVKFEIRFVALRNIRVVVHKYRAAFVPFVNSFYLKFDDPIYVKLDKLEVMLALATEDNAAAVLAELAEYAQEIDVELVRRAVRAMGTLAVALPSIAPQCVERLVQLLGTRVGYVVQEVAVVVQAVLRQYPRQYEGVIVRLCEALDVLDDPDSKAAVVWVVGEYAGRIDNAVEIVELFLEHFADELLPVQLAVLTATVKVYCTTENPAPAEAKQRLLEGVLARATASGAPDLRDRAFFYWRLVLADPATAMAVVRSEKDAMADRGLFDRHTLAQMVQDIGRLSAVMLRPAESFLGKERRAAPAALDDSDEEIDEDARARARDALEQGAVPAVPLAAAPSTQAQVAADTPAVAPTQDVLSFLDAPAPPPPADTGSQSAPLSVVLDSEAGRGLQVSMRWAGPSPTLECAFRVDPAATDAPVVRLRVLQLNVNAFGLGLAQEFPAVELRPSALGTGAHGADPSVARLSLAVNTANRRSEASVVQIALQTEPMGVLFFEAPPVPAALLLLPAPAIDAPLYAQEFQALGNAWVLPGGPHPTGVTPGHIAAASLKLAGVTLVHSREAPPHTGLHLYAKAITGAALYCEATVEGEAVVICNVRTPDPTIAAFFGEYIVRVLTGRPAP